MLLTLLIFELLLTSLLLCFCSAAPTKKVAYSRQEDELIIKELQTHAKTYNSETWKFIEKAHEKRLKEKAPGFFKARKAHSLHLHFRDVMKTKAIELPDTLKQLSYERKDKPYSPEEENLINEVLWSWHSNLYSDALWREMSKKHAEKRRSGCSGFTYIRTGQSLRSHFVKVMTPKGLIHDEVKHRFTDYFKNERGCTSTDGNQTEYVLDENVGSRFSHQEEELIITMLESQASTYTSKVWDDIAEAHKQKLQTKAPGFITQRPANSLQKHFKNMIRSGRDFGISETLKLLCHEKMHKSYSLEENKLINAELLASEGNLFSDRIWGKIKEKHDKLRESGAPGFKCRRTIDSLRTHFKKVMKQRGLVDEAVKQKFRNCYLWNCYDAGVQHRGRRTGLGELDTAQ